MTAPFSRYSGKEPGTERPRNVTARSPRIKPGVSKGENQEVRSAITGNEQSQGRFAPHVENPAFPLPQWSARNSTGYVGCHGLRCNPMDRTIRLVLRRLVGWDRLLRSCVRHVGIVYFQHLYLDRKCRMEGPAIRSIRLDPQMGLLCVGPHLLDFVYCLCCEPSYALPNGDEKRTGNAEFNCGGTVSRIYRFYLPPQ